jgi:hypothetical protein
MRFSRLVVVVCAAALLLEGLGACVGGTELNPQPLPPEDPTANPPPRAPSETADPNEGKQTGGGGLSADGASGDGGADAADTREGG